MVILLSCSFHFTNGSTPASLSRFCEHSGVPLSTSIKTELPVLLALFHGWIRVKKQNEKTAQVPGPFFSGLVTHSGPVAAPWRPHFSLPLRRSCGFTSDLECSVLFLEYVLFNIQPHPLCFSLPRQDAAPRSLLSELGHLCGAWIQLRWVADVLVPISSLQVTFSGTRTAPNVAFRTDTRHCGNDKGKINSESRMWLDAKTQGKLRKKEHLSWCSGILCNHSLSVLQHCLPQYQEAQAPRFTGPLPKVIVTTAGERRHTRPPHCLVNCAQSSRAAAFLGHHPCWGVVTYLPWSYQCFCKWPHRPTGSLG